MTDCVFCPANWDNLSHIPTARRDDVAIINPLNPVTKGHVLVIAARHTENAAQDYDLAGELMRVAAAYVLGAGIQANIITSIGPDATQTVMHTHLHVVPRRLNDDLPLPWTPQQMGQER
jgi:histidine triad (HIT) family protein